MGTQESEATLRQQVEETGGSQGLEQPTGGAAPPAGVPAPLTTAGPAPSVGVPENTKALLEEIIEEASAREVPTAEEHERRLKLLSDCIRKGMGKAVGKIINYGGKPESYLYFEAPLVFAIAKEARCDYAPLRLPNGKGFDRENIDGTVVYYAEAFATCPMLGTSIGMPPGAGVGMMVSSEDKFLLGSAKSAGKWGHERNMMLKAQTQAMRKACVKLLGLDGITEAVLKKIMGERMPHITVVKFGG